MFVCVCSFFCGRWLVGPDVLVGPFLLISLLFYFCFYFLSFFGYYFVFLSFAIKLLNIRIYRL